MKILTLTKADSTGRMRAVLVCEFCGHSNEPLYHKQSEAEFTREVLPQLQCKSCGLKTGDTTEEKLAIEVHGLLQLSEQIKAHAERVLRMYKEVLHAKDE